MTNVQRKAERRMENVAPSQNGSTLRPRRGPKSNQKNAVKEKKKVKNMENKTIHIRRFRAIPGVGAAIVNSEFVVPQAQKREDLLNLFAGEIEDKETKQKRQKNEEEIWSDILSAANRAKVREVKKAQSLASDPKSAVATFKALIRNMAGALHDDPGAAEKEAVGKMLLEQNPKLRERLESEGVVFGDVKTLREQFKASAPSTESDEDDDDEDDNE